MIVKELVRELANCDWDAEVYVLWDRPEGYDSSVELNTDEVSTHRSIGCTEWVIINCSE